MTDNEHKNTFAELWPTYKRFVAYVKPDAGLIWLDYLTILIAVVTNTAMIWLIGKPFNLLQNQQYDLVANTLMLFAGVLLVNQLVQLTGGLLTNKIGLNSIGRIRNAIIEKCLNLSFPVAGQVPKGDLMARLSNDVDRIKFTVVDTPIFVVSHVLTFTIYTGMLFWIDITLALIALLVSSIFVIQQKLFSTPKRHAAENFFNHNGKLLAMEEQSISNMRGVSTYSAESLVTKLHRHVFSKTKFWALRERGLDVGFNVSFTLLLYLAGLVIVLFGVDGIKEERIGIGHLVSFMLYLGYINVPARGLADLLFQSFGNVGAAKRILEVFDAQALVTEKPDATELVVTQGAVEVSNVDFTYPQGEIIFKNVSLQVAPGETIALVGPSGAGKSTLAMLLMRFYDPQQGQILIDGTDICDCTIESLRRNVSVVWQQPFLVNDTIKANMLMVKPDATNIQITHACQHSYAWEFINALEQGLDTRIGADGITLSTGQIQRLAVAQALLRDAPILVLDEATSALDSLSEINVVKAMSKLREGRTTFIIAHRFSSIKDADRVVYFNHDNTITVGKHAELIKTHKDYQQAVAWQTREVD